MCTAYDKASELLQLAKDVASRRFGMSYADINRYSMAPTDAERRRNTQRLVRVLERVFGPSVSTRINEQGEKLVQLEASRLRDLVDLTENEMTAFDRAIDVLNAANALPDAQALAALRTKVRLLAPGQKLRRLDVDYEALLHAGYVAIRQGPSPRVDPAVMEPVTEAILAVKRVSFDYRTGDSQQRRTVHPYGVVFGHRLYLVALVVEVSGNDPSTWRVDRMSNVTVENDQPATIPADFNLAVHARRAFDAFYRDEEYGDVEWRFSAAAAENAITYCFHPDQQVTREPDGAVTIRFNASGLLEMAWALYPCKRSADGVLPEVPWHEGFDFRCWPALSDAT